MKKLSLLTTLLLLLLCHMRSIAAEAITSIWLDAKTVSQLAENGATTLKLYAGIDNNGRVCYMMAGADAEYNINERTVLMQNQKGVCPPQCDVTSADLTSKNVSSISTDQASQYVNKYMRTNPKAVNCVTFNMSQLTRLLNASTYVQVMLDAGATASGFDADGNKAGAESVSGKASTAGM